MTCLRALLGAVVLCWAAGAQAEEASPDLNSNESTATQTAEAPRAPENAPQLARWSTQGSEATLAAPDDTGIPWKQSSEIFSDGFESGNTLAWDGYTCETPFIIPTDLTGGS